ncbi:unnamed protein product [Arabis nemorensis]|uniref:Carboxypeptidase n=1 Tax=Arabis nemorensis TaxID=586526 RepID=A0A565CQX2_9BRAS|nr:unnamed protein product [Arabis nemorensis]
MYKSKRDIGSASDTSHFNANRRISMPLLRTSISGVNQQELKEKDLIKNLPGQPPVSFKQYGGYVAINESAGPFFYYYFVEAIRANNSSPLVVWFNGGPSCSSLQGAFLEHGPFRVHSDGKTLYRNPYSWNDETNVLYIESPAGVGFSYMNNSSALENIGDKKTAENNYMFLVKWLERFSEYKGRDVYIAGQSYAGHYCPQLAQLILHNKNQTLINLRGVLIGNPGLDSNDEIYGEYEYLFNHALISPKQWDNYNKLCINGEDSGGTECFKSQWSITEQTSHINLYNIYAPICLNSTLTSKPKEYTTVKNFDPCSPEYLTAYLNLANVQKAMHANTTKLPYAWTKCNYEQNDLWSNNDRDASMIPILEELTGSGVRVWVYSGDMDAAVPHTSTMHVLRKMNLTIEKIWRPWFSEGEVGGYTEEYKNKFTYATVRGAGHMVPSDQPIRALTLFTSFIRNMPLPGTL